MRSKHYGSQPVSGHESPKSASSRPVSTSFEHVLKGLNRLTTEVDLPSPALQSLILAKSHYLESSMIYLSFVSESTWDLSALVGEIAQWLNDATTSKTSEVGTLWSPQFLNLDKNTMTNSHRISYAESLAYTQADIKDNHSLNAFEIYQIGAIGGHELLNFLEEKLESQALEGCSREDLQALFLFVFGTILAVGSTRLISSQIAVLGVVSYQIR